MSCITLAFLLNFANEVCGDNYAKLVTVGMANESNRLVVVCEYPKGNTLSLLYDNYFKNKNKCISLKSKK